MTREVYIGYVPGYYQQLPISCNGVPEYVVAAAIMASTGIEVTGVKWANPKGKLVMLLSVNKPSKTITHIDVWAGGRSNVSELFEAYVSGHQVGNSYVAGIRVKEDRLKSIMSSKLLIEGCDKCDEDFDVFSLPLESQPMVDTAVNRVDQLVGGLSSVHKMTVGICEDKIPGTSVINYYGLGELDFFNERTPGDSGRSQEHQQNF